MAETSQKLIKKQELDPKFKYEISKMHGGENLMRCFQCGTCTSDCPIAKFSEIYRPRTLIRMAQLGLKDKVLKSESLWLCASCYTCTDRCPQGIKVASIIRVLKNLAVKKGYAPAFLKEQAKNITETGYIFKIPTGRIKKREKIGLPQLPKSNKEKIQKSIEKIKDLKVTKKGL
jgi:heterodisulfide reductase subunit C